MHQEMIHVHQPLLKILQFVKKTHKKMHLKKCKLIRTSFFWWLNFPREKPYKILPKEMIQIHCTHQLSLKMCSTIYENMDLEHHFPHVSPVCLKICKNSVSQKFKQIRTSFSSYFQGEKESIQNPTQEMIDLQLSQQIELENSL